MRQRIALVAIVFALPWSNALAVTINTNNVASADYIAFTTGATVQNFESVSGLTPLSITAYTNGASVPSSAQMHGQIPNLFFHSGGANPNNTAANPGTPVALLTLAGGIAGNAHSGTKCCRSTPDYDRSHFTSGSWACGRQFSGNHLLDSC